MLLLHIWHSVWSWNHWDHKECWDQHQYSTELCKRCCVARLTWAPAPMRPLRMSMWHPSRVTWDPSSSVAPASDTTSTTGLAESPPVTANNSLTMFMIIKARSPAAVHGAPSSQRCYHPFWQLTPFHWVVPHFFQHTLGRNALLQHEQSEHEYRTEPKGTREIRCRLKSWHGCHSL
jgi:hypothetical protein